MIELETNRLVLRRWSPRDVDAFARFYADEDQTRYIGGPLPREKAWRRLATLVGHWVLRGYGEWAIEERSTGDFVGSVGLWRPAEWPDLELCYWVVREKLRMGYATEGGRAARDFAFEVLHAESLVSYIHPDNEASKRVAERLGARFDEQIELLSYGPQCVYRYA